MRTSIIVLTALAASVLAAPASAADIGRSHRSDVMRVGYASPALWTGFYVGINAGYGSGSVDQQPVFNGPDGEPLAKIKPTGWLGGVTAGYNWQSGRFVAGLETDFQLSDLTGKRSVDWCKPFCFGATSVETIKVSMPWFGTVRGRVGFTPTDSVLIYGTGGAAYAKVRMANDFSFSDRWGFDFTSTSTSNGYAVGWVAGGGVEWALSRSWSVKLEGLHMALAVTDSRSTCTFCTPFSSSTDIAVNIVRGGVNYRF